MPKLLIASDPTGSASHQSIQSGWAPEDITVWELDSRHAHAVSKISDKIDIILDDISLSKLESITMKFDVVIGNPPYGNAGGDALKFLNKMAELELSKDIRLIMPRSIRKASLLNSVNRHIHIVEDVTNDPMLFGRKIKTVTQKYEYRDELRDLIPQPRTHSDFQFLKKGDSSVNIFVMRSGYAGKVLTEDYDDYEQSHYFIHANNEQVIDNIKSISEELIVLGEETTNMNKVSIPEIITTYTKHFGG